MSLHSIEHSIIGASEHLCTLRAMVEKVAPAAVPVLVQGPTGAGKELVARALHDCSGRRGAYIPFNVCAVAEGTAESELFGHVRGAFTGAHRDAPGLLAAADGGTVVLDEINGLSPSLQAKLLRAIDYQEVRAVGATRAKRYDFRVVAVSNQDLRELVAARTFRADLFHRLGGVVIDVPALVDHLDDIPSLVKHFSATLRQRYGTHLLFDPSAIAALAQYDWPGNVRELWQVIQRLAVLSDTPYIGADQVHAALPLPERAGTPTDDLGSDRRLELLAVLDQHGRDIAAAARYYGVHPVTMYRWLHRSGIPVRPYRRGHVRSS